MCRRLQGHSRPPSASAPQGEQGWDITAAKLEFQLDSVISFGQPSTDASVGPRGVSILIWAHWRKNTASEPPPLRWPCIPSSVPTARKAPGKRVSAFWQRAGDEEKRRAYREHSQGEGISPEGIRGGVGRRAHLGQGHTDSKAEAESGSLLVRDEHTVKKAEKVWAMLRNDWTLNPKGASPSYTAENKDPESQLIHAACATAESYQTWICQTVNSKLFYKIPVRAELKEIFCLKLVSHSRLEAHGDRGQKRVCGTCDSHLHNRLLRW